MQAVCKALADGGEQKFMGKEVVIMTWGSGNNDTLEYLDVDTEPSDKDEEEADTEGYDPKSWALNKFENALTDKDRFIMSTMDS